MLSWIRVTRAVTGLHYKEIMGEVRYQELRSELGPDTFKAGMGAESVQQLLEILIWMR